MLCFIRATGNRKKNNSQNDNNQEDDDFEISLLVMAKKVGLSFEELRIFSLDDFFTFLEIHIGEEDNSPRQADQDDIDNFYNIL